MLPKKKIISNYFTRKSAWRCPKSKVTHTTHFLEVSLLDKVGDEVCTDLIQKPCPVTYCAVTWQRLDEQWGQPSRLPLATFKGDIHFDTALLNCFLASPALGDHA